MTMGQFPDPARPMPAASSASSLRARGAMLCLLSVLALLVLVRDAATHQGLARYDRAVSLLLHNAGTPLHAQLLGGVTALHSTLGILGMGALLAACLLRRGEKAWLALWCMVVPAGMLANLALKHLVRRPRPSFDGALPHLSNFSFPSGHTTGAALFYGFLVLYGLGRTAQAPRRWLLVLAACAMTALVAFSRVYLGFHFPSDVAASVVLALAWTGGVLAIAGLPTRPALSKA
jgi:undecaprenyl-diphosphatase